MRPHMRRPLWMLSDRILAAGSILAGSRSRSYSPAMAWKSSSAVLEDEPAHHRRHAPHPETSLPATVMMAAGFCGSWLFYIRRPYLRSAANNSGYSTSSAHKCYFDELYDLIFVRQRSGWTLPVEVGDVTLLTLRPDGVSAGCLDVTRNVCGSDGYLYNYAFAMLIGGCRLITWFMFGVGAQ